MYVLPNWFPTVGNSDADCTLSVFFLTGTCLFSFWEASFYLIYFVSLVIDKSETWGIYTQNGTPACHYVDIPGPSALKTNFWAFSSPAH